MSCKSILYRYTYVLSGRLPPPTLRLRDLQGEAGTLSELRDPPQGPGGRHLRGVWVAATAGLPSPPTPGSDHSLL